MADESPYDFYSGGSLKLKGENVKKKKKSKSKAERDLVKDSVKAELLRKDSQLKGSDSPNGSPGPSTSTSQPVDNKTQAQRRFDEAQRIRRAERVAKLATKTHKDRVHEFNEKLEALSEHHDIPKVGPG